MLSELWVVGCLACHHFASATKIGASDTSCATFAAGPKPAARSTNPKTSTRVPISRTATNPRQSLRSRQVMHTFFPLQRLVNHYSQCCSIVP